MNIVVAGGAGFIGSHLCEALLNVGHAVTAIDNFITGREVNVQHLAGHPRFMLIEHDVCEPIKLDADVVVQLASPASPVAYWTYPIETMRTNSLGTENLLRLSVENRAVFVLASTSEVYGNPLEHPQREDYWGNVNPIGPRACYDEGKRYAEAITSEYGKAYGLDWRIARIFNTYGPRNDPLDGRVVPNLIMHALQGKPLPIHGDGTQTRSLCYVADMTAGIIDLLSSASASCQIVNLGSTEEISVLEIARLLAQHAGVPLDVMHLSARREEIERRRPELTKAETWLGWRPRVLVRDGLALTYDWYRDELASRRTVVLAATEASEVAQSG